MYFKKQRNAMDDKELRMRWPELKTKIKQQYPDMTEEELLYEIGKEEELLKRLQDRLGKNRKEIFNWLSLMG